MRSELGLPALAKVREAVMGPNGNNLDDLVRLDGITLKPLISIHLSVVINNQISTQEALVQMFQTRMNTGKIDV